jgi:hypothetical protein
MPTDHIAMLHKTIGQLRAIEAAINEAQALPNRYANQVDLVGIYGREGNYGPSASDDAIQAVLRGKRRAAADERRRGEIERDEKLAALAIELHSLRCALPAVAASASISLGTLARKIAGSTDGA